ncbi:MAG TPA: hypothetical protein VD833_07750 [Vicinamibacterales bacterium]|nr:hypothetical protein [Vicinamibacterales bacterium]
MIPSAQRGEWISFEVRMRRRRLARCLLRADLAIEDGDLTAAREALEEAREIDASSPGLMELQVRLCQADAWAGRRTGDHLLTGSEAPGGQALAGLTGSCPGELAHATVDQPPPTTAIDAENLRPVPDIFFRGIPADNDMPPPTAANPARWRRRAVNGSIAAAVAFGLLLAWSTGREAPREPEARPPATPAAVPTVPTPSPTLSVDADGERVRIARELVVAQQASMRMEGAEETPEPPPPALGPPVAAAEPQTERADVVAALNVRPAEPEPAAEPERNPPPSPQPEPLPVATSGVAALPAATPVPLDPPTFRMAGTPAGPAAVDESARVRTVLARYEVAYSALDAGAASEVWPRVNRGALERAFGGLTSQRVSLGSCDVTVEGPAARATCRGRASWIPKVGGGGQRTEPRRWTFELRKSTEGWLIESADTR